MILGIVASSRKLGASAVVTAYYPTAHSIIAGWNGGTGLNNKDWQNVTNAYANNASLATIAAAATSTNADGFEDAIDFQSFGIDQTVPAGHTRTIEVVVRYGYEFVFTHTGTFGVGDRLVIEGRSSQSGVTTCLDQTNANNTRALAESRFDITTWYDGLNNSQKLNVGVRFSADATVPVGLGENASVDLDFVSIVTTDTPI